MPPKKSNKKFTTRNELIAYLDEILLQQQLINVQYFQMRVQITYLVCLALILIRIQL